MSFVHIHTHSEYSLLDGAIKITDLVEKVVELGQTAVAVTDHGWMASAVKLVRGCEAADIKPIIGSELYIATQEDMSEAASNPGDNFHLTVLVRNVEGLANLRRITSLAHLRGMSYKPRVDKQTLAAHADGLIVTSGCVAAELPQLLIYGDTKGARVLIEWYIDVFGDSFFIEVMSHGSIGGIDHVRVEESGKVLMLEHELNDALVSLAKRYSIPVVASNDAHYLTHDDGDAHDSLLCIGMGAWKTKKGRLRFPGAEHEAWEFYVKSEDEMRAASTKRWWHQACDNTTHLADLVESGLFEWGRTLLPTFTIPNDPGFKLWQKTGLIL